MKQMKTRESEQAGWTMVELLIVMALLGLLAAAAAPSFLKARSEGWKNICVLNLKKIAEAKSHWAVEQRKSAGDVPVESDLVGRGRYLRRMPACPSGGTYSLGAVEEKPTCQFAETQGHKL
jgi:prepilin-type N-terminal cleavage/methylation domain-containing protein